MRFLHHGPVDSQGAAEGKTPGGWVPSRKLLHCSPISWPDVEPLMCMWGALYSFPGSFPTTFLLLLCHGDEVLAPSRASQPQTSQFSCSCSPAQRLHLGHHWQHLILQDLSGSSFRPLRDPGGQALPPPRRLERRQCNG